MDYSQSLEDDEPREKCGVFGVYGPELDVSRLAFFGLVALQHRGQESCGIATYLDYFRFISLLVCIELIPWSCDDRGFIHAENGMGLVSQVYNETNLKHLVGKMALGHTR